MKIQVLFEKNTSNDKFIAGWGTAYLLDGRVLFDTGENPRYLLNNMAVAGISVDQIETVVISHNHWDHRNGLPALLEIKKNIAVFAGQDYIDEFQSYLLGCNARQSQALDEIITGLYCTGYWPVMYKEKLLQEQMLIVHTRKGLSLICACCHIGIIYSLKKIKEFFPNIPLYTVVGGLHLMDSDNRTIEYIGRQLQILGVRRLMPGHCTGHNAIEILNHCISSGTEELSIGLEFEV